MRYTLRLFGLIVATLHVEHDEQWDWYLTHEGLADLLERAHDGEVPGMLLTELHANAEH